jgi:hypothetical protein
LLNSVDTSVVSQNTAHDQSLEFVELLKTAWKRVHLRRLQIVPLLPFTSVAFD